MGRHTNRLTLLSSIRSIRSLTATDGITSPIASTSPITHKAAPCQHHVGVCIEDYSDEDLQDARVEIWNSC